MLYFLAQTCTLYGISREVQDISQRQKEAEDMQRRREEEEKYQNSTRQQGEPLPGLDFNKYRPNASAQGNQGIQPGEDVPLETGGGSITVALKEISQDQQRAIWTKKNKKDIPDKFAEPKIKTAKSLPLPEGALITKPITCPVFLLIDSNGKLFGGSDGITVLREGLSAQQRQLCQQYAQEYFKDIEFIPAQGANGSKPYTELVQYIEIAPTTGGSKKL